MKIKDLMQPTHLMVEKKWSQARKRAVDCDRPKGFSEKAHCAGRKARSAHKKTKSSSVSEATTRTSKSGAPGTLKAKITKAYGGDVTCAKTERLKRRKNATPHDKRQANWFQNKHCGGASRVDEATIPELIEWPTYLAWKIQFKRFHNMDSLIDERKDKVYMMPFVNWESTYYSLTNKDLQKVKFMPTQVYQVAPDALVGDMYLINQALRTKDVTQREGLLQQYRSQLVSYQQFIQNPHMFRMPEILATSAQLQAHPGKVTAVWDTHSKALKLGITKPSKTKLDLTEIFQEPATQHTWRKLKVGNSVMYDTQFEFDNKNVVIELVGNSGEHTHSLFDFMGIDDLQLRDDSVGYELIFRVNRHTSITGEIGIRAGKLLSLVVSAVRGFLNANHWDYVTFTGAGDSRSKLYQAMVQKLTDQVNARFKSKSGFFVIYRDPAVVEHAGGVGLVKTSTHGDAVTCDNALRGNSRSGATAHDVSETNWFTHMHGCSESTQLTEIFSEPAQHVKWNRGHDRSYEFFETEFSFQNKRVMVGLYEDHDQTSARFVIRNNDLQLPSYYKGYSVVFKVNGSTDATGEMGTAASKLFAQVVAVLKGFLSTHAWDYVLFVGEPGSRDRLYDALAHVLANQVGAQVATHRSDFLIYKPLTELREQGGVGLVVPGVNTPAGIHPDEIRRQARKWGFKVTAQGVPPTARTDGKF